MNPADSSWQMYAVQASTLCDEFAELRERFPSDPESISEDNIVTITNMSQIEPSISSFELLTLVMHVDVDCYRNILLDDEFYQFKIRENDKMNYSVYDDNVPDGLIYCARYDKIVRGYNLRPHNKKCTNSIMIQTYYSGRNVNVKISADNILFCGPVCEDDCRTILEMVVSRLNQALDDVAYIQSHEEEVREFMRVCPSMSFKKAEFEPYIRYAWVEPIDDDHLREIVLRVAIGSRSTSVLVTRLRSILALSRTARLPSKVEDYGLNIVMMKASYKLPYAFPLIEFYSYLGTLPGLRYTVDYHPDVLQKMKVFILRYDNDYQYLDECTSDQTLPYNLCERSGYDEDTASSMATIEEIPWSQIETISIASTFTVNQVSFNTHMLRETRSMFLSIIDDFINSHATTFYDL